MGWIYLILAGICEIGWPLGLKFASESSNNRLIYVLLAAIAISVSGFLLFLSQRTIPLGTAYAVWTGIGAIGAFVVGVIWFKDPATAGRIVSVLLITAGVIGLKLSS